MYSTCWVETIIFYYINKMNFLLIQDKINCMAAILPSPSAQLAENSAVAYSVATAVATDADFGSDGDITFSIECEYSSIYPPLSLSSLSLSLSLSFSLSRSLSLSLCHPLSLSMYISLSLPRSLSRSISLFIKSLESLSLYICPLSVSVSLSVYMYRLYLSLSLPIFLSISAPLALSASRSPRFICICMQCCLCTIFKGTKNYTCTTLISVTNITIDI